MNKVLIIGHLGRDPEVRFTAAGDPICTLNIATSERFRDKAGEQREATEWHRVVLYRRLAEIGRDHLRKGSQVYIEGSLKTRKWTDKAGQERYTTEVEGREMKMLGGGSRSSDAPDAAMAGKTQTASPRPATSLQVMNDDDGDDIPF